MKVQKVVIIGGGTMGRGIAHVAALANYSVVMADFSNDILINALDMITENLQKGVKKNKISEEEKSKALKKIEITVDWGVAVEDADLILEAIPEQIDLKLELLKSLDQKAPIHCVFATNTSSLSISEMAAVTRRPDKVIGMHFFNPVHLMPLVEIVKGLETSDNTINVAQVVSKRMGKISVSINEYPGFITSRISAMIGNEAFYMLESGVASAEDIDRAVKLGLNFPMGPFELGDIVGLDTRLKVLEHLNITLGEKFKPCPLLMKYVKAGRYGQKTGRGVYDYSNIL